MPGQQGGSGPANPAEPISVSVGATFELDLPELPGSGYQWIVQEIHPGPSVISVTWAVPMPQGVGASRLRRFTVRADRPGEFHLTFELRRPWEDAVVTPPAQLRTFLVRVHPAP
jgi:predicted secreted protein